MTTLITNEDTTIPFGEEAPASFDKERLTKVERGKLKGKVTKRARRVQTLMKRATTAPMVLEAELASLIKHYNVLVQFHTAFLEQRSEQEKPAAIEYIQDVQLEVMQILKHGEEWLKCNQQGKSYILPSSSDEDEELGESILERFSAQNEERFKALEERLCKQLEALTDTSAVTSSTPFKTSGGGVGTRRLGLSTIQENMETTADPQERSAPSSEVAELVQGLSSSLKAVLQEVKEDSRSSITNKSTSTYHVPKFKLHQFSGENVDYLPFIKAFETQVESQVDDPAALLGTLIAHTPEDVSRSLRFCNMRGTPAEAYRRAREMLDETYGKFEDIATAWLDKFHAMKDVKTVEELKRLHTMLVNCQETLLAVDQVGDFETKTNIYLIVSKLPGKLRERWQQWAVEVQETTKKRAKLRDLIKFVFRVHMEKADPVYGGPLEDGDERKRQGKKTTMATSRDLSFEPNPEVDVPVLMSEAQPRKDKKKRLIECTYCSENHILYRCKAFRDLDVQERMRVVTEKNVCSNCFHPNHLADKCKSPYRCHICKQAHHTMLHDNSRVVNACNSAVSTGGAHQGHQVATAVVAGKVALPIVVVVIRNGDLEYKTYALLDTGSSCTLCTDEVISKLGLPYEFHESTVSTVTGAKQLLRGKITDLVVSGMIRPEQTFKLKGVISRPSLNLSTSCRATPVEIAKWPHLQGLSIPEVDVTEVELLIGMDHPALLKERGRRDGNRDEDPSAVLTTLGWYVAGPICDSSPILASYAVTSDADVKLQECVEKFWATDDIVSCEAEPSLSANDRKVLKLWEREIVHDGKNYYMPIPFKEDPPSIENNRVQAERKLWAQARTLNRPKNAELKKKYITGMRKYIDKGKALPVAEGDEGVPGLTNYLSHHWVIHPRKLDVIRAVFNAALKWLGLSLNDHIHSGPDLMNRLLDVLLGFREDRYVLLGDIEGMFSQIFVALLQTDCLRFLWWEDDIVGGKVVVYKMCTHIFGGVWSPSAANFALKRTAEDFGAEFSQETVDSVKHRFYVDDGVDSKPTPEKCVRLGEELHGLLIRGGFNYTKLNSNSDEVIRELAEKKLIEDPETLLSADGPYFVLGNRWYRKSDRLKYSGVLPDKPPTKRGVLSTLCGLYDPLGLISPIIMTAKLIFQDCCRQKLGWDDTLTPHLMARWLKWKTEVEERMDDVEFDRCLLPEGYTTETPGISFDMHMFSDASSAAYGGLGYLRTLQWGKPVGVSLVMGKGRLAPIKQQSIPRLELAGAHTAVHLKNYLQRALRLKLDSITFWVDSTIVLYYIYNSEARYPPYVGNRVGFIRDHTEPGQWKHVPTALNPADLISRGTSPEELQQSYLWKHGPMFLLQDRDQWPVCDANWEEVGRRAERVKEREEPMYATVTATAPETPAQKFLDYHSSFFRMKARLVTLSKFLKYLAKREFSKRTSLEELEKAEYSILKYVQDEMVNSATPAQKRQCEKMYPQRVNGLLRVGGRLQNAGLSPDAQHQVIVPRSQVARAIIQDIHLELGHVGAQRTLYETRERYWLVGGVKQVKSVIRGCVPCRRLSAAPVHPPMANLPAERVEEGQPPFHNSGVDYFGPFLVKTGRVERKRYGCLFTCMVTRAIHIEMAWSLDTDSCLNAIFRFASRRGMPRRLRSDNGTNLTSSKEEMKRAIAAWNQEHMKSKLIQKGCEWVCNTPAASHQGGAWERQIRTVRKILTHLLDGQRLTDECLQTFFCLAEDVVNGRPITALGEDVRDLRPLSPNSLLRPKTGVMLPPGITVERDRYRKRWKHVQYLIDQYWKRWRLEYLTGLQIRTKWLKSVRSLKVGDLVILQTEHAPRNVWPMARVIETYPGEDGVVRSVKIHTTKGDYRRPVHKLCLLEAADEKV